MINHVYICFSAVQLMMFHIFICIFHYLRVYYELISARNKNDWKYVPVSNLQNAEKLDLMQKAISAHTTYTKEVTNYNTKQPGRIVDGWVR